MAVLKMQKGWKLLVPELENRGHTVLTVDLPLDEPAASATRHADVVLQTLDLTTYRNDDVVVVAHSASGMFLPLVASRRPVGHMVFLAALVPKLGTSILEQFRTDPEMLNPEWVGKNPMEDGVARQFLFHDCSPELLEWALSTRVLMNAREAMTEMCPLEAWPSVGSSYILCSEDRTISPAWSRRIVRERLRVEPIELSGGHCPHISRPSELANALTDPRVTGSNPCQG